MGLHCSIELAFAVIASANERANAAVAVKHDKGPLACPERRTFFCQAISDDLLGPALQIPVERRLDDKLGMALSDHRR